MKKILIILTALALTMQSAQAISFSLPVKASEVTVPIGSTGKKISLQELSQISVKDFEILTGKKLSFADKTMFKVTQKKIRHSINADGTINNKKIEKYYKKYSDGDSGFNLGGFALGFLLGLIGVLIAYIINNDNNHSRRKWAWIGFGIYVVLYLIIIAAAS